MIDLNSVHIYLYNEPTDMRKSIDTLAVLIADKLTMNPSNGALYLFRNRYGDKLKALHYEQNCFTLWYRRLENGKWIFPKDRFGVIEMSREHFHWLLASDKYRQLSALQPVNYGHVY